MLTEKSVLDTFPRERLVYLTPNSMNVLHRDDPDNVYIVGALMNDPVPRSLESAKRQGIRHARLPMRETLG